MNKLLNPISWNTYLGICFLIAIAYYAFIGWKYYRQDIQKLINRLSGKTDDSKHLPAALQYQPEEIPESKTTTAHPQEHYNPDEGEFTGAARSLVIRLSECIDQAADEPFAPAILVPKLKKILNDHPDVAATPDREKINAFVAGECEKTGTALLSESEVDMWWSA